MNPDTNTNPTPPITQTPSPTNRPPVKLYLLVLLALTLLGLFTLSLLNRQPTQPSPSALNQAKQVSTISITDKTLNPAVIKVKAGSTVTWTNTGTKLHQIAADPYPRDDSIPGFNSTVILKPNDKLAFIFSQPGTYTYHDEKNPLKPAFRGTVVVE